MRTDNMRMNEKKQKGVIAQAALTIALLLMGCISFIACDGKEKQKEMSSDSSVHSVENEVELPEVEF